MTKKRYKIRKEQLERVVESFVMESAAPEAKKHIEEPMEGDMVEKNVKEPSTVKKDKKKQAPEAKKHVMTKMSESVEELTEEELAEFWGDKAKEKRKARLEADYNKYANAWLRKRAITKPTEEEYNEFMAKAEADGYKGRVAKEGDKMYYRASTEKETAAQGYGMSGGRTA
jgi:hypothetical protein